MIPPFTAETKRKTSISRGVQRRVRNNVRQEERIGERTRLARDLHDRLLQGFHGLMLRLHVVLLPEGKAKEQGGAKFNQIRPLASSNSDWGATSGSPSALR